MGKTFIQTKVIMVKERDPFVDSLNHFVAGLEEEMVTGILYQQAQDSSLLL